MSQYSVKNDVGTVFDAAATAVSALKTPHTSVSTAIDTAQAAVSDAKCAALSTALAGVYNRVLDPAMTGAQVQAGHAITSGRTAVRYILQGVEAMVDQTEAASAVVPEFTMSDGKR